MGYRWYEEDIASFILKYDLPSYNFEYDMKKFYKLQKKNFLSDFDLMIAKKQNRAYSKDFYQQLKSIKTDIEKVFQTIFDVLVNYDNLNFSKAQDLFDKLMENLQSNLRITSISAYEGYKPNLYRIRSVKTGEHLKQPSDLFHIPYTKRHLIKNERYSLAGHPCLYLATYLGIAWQECGFPSQFYYSQFDYVYELQPEAEWKFITLISPLKFAQTFLLPMNPEDESRLLDSICRYLKTYPLILACSIVNLNGDSVFKPEYIIPQMLLQWVQRNYGKIHGITYFSCVANDDNYGINGYNVVIPANSFNPKGFGENLTKRFKISKPIFCNNLISDTGKECISSFKKELKQNLASFPYSANECMSMMYDVCHCFDILISKTEKTDMKLIISSVNSVENNCKFMKSRFLKQEIIEKAEKENAFNGSKEKIDNFSIFYDRFWNDVEPIISKYNFDLLKVSVPDTNEFFVVK